MTENSSRQYGVWNDSASYLAGENPLAMDPSRHVVVAQARDIIQGRSMFLASNNQSGLFDDWRPLAFFGTKDKSYRKISTDKQIEKYYVRRAKALERIREESRANGAMAAQRAMDQRREPSEDLPEAPPVQDQQAPVAEGQLVLTLSQEVVELLRDTFTLVAQGRAVTIQAQAPQENSQG